MSTADLIEEYLAKAKEAEDQALRCRDQKLKESWQSMAMSYREMAQHELGLVADKAKAVQSSQLPTSSAREGE